MSDTFERLRAFLDTLPAGYPATPTGVEIRILEKLFTPEEAELTMQLSRDPEPLSEIAVRLTRDEGELGAQLESLVQKGLIFRVRENGRTSYQAFQFMVGIYEFQVNRLDAEFARLFEEYLPYYGLSLARLKTKQLRVIPVESAIRVDRHVAPYNKIRDLVRGQDLISVAECICRKEQQLLGKECDRPKETCLGFGQFARFYIDNGWGRQIAVEEALQVLELAEEAGLVLSPSNTQELAHICCCCPCCCPVLRAVKVAPKSKYVTISAYQARIDPELCIACRQCLERCQVQAIREKEGFAEVVTDKCIGCGLCVAACPEEAISLVELEGVGIPPADLKAVMKQIEMERRLLQNRP
jgi:Na+-translocating ferredoxin:NAD+ oxidoreductase subunit B